MHFLPALGWLSSSFELPAVRNLWLSATVSGEGRHEVTEGPEREHACPSLPAWHGQRLSHTASLTSGRMRNRDEHRISVNNFWFLLHFHYHIYE